MTALGAGDWHKIQHNYTHLDGEFKITVGCATSARQLYTLAANMLPSKTLQRKIETEDRSALG
jgi:hypothetical protein